MSDSDHKPPRPAASVILMRARADGAAEVYLQRRHRKASFMSSAFVFPGGAADQDEDDLRLTAVRELFEEAGVLLAAGPAGAPLAASADALTQARDVLNHGQGSFAQVLRELGATLDLDRLRYFAHWITPSVERKRFSAQFFVACMPAGQTASPDHTEMVDDIWVTPAQALARAGELRLPPPQLRTFVELDRALQVAAQAETAPAPAALVGDAGASAEIAALWALAQTRAANRHPILPRLLPSGPPITLLLPWDPEYQNAGAGESLAMPADHPLAVGPSRFVRENDTWNHISAASSPSAE